MLRPTSLLTLNERIVHVLGRLVPVTILESEDILRKASVEHHSILRIDGLLHVAGLARVERPVRNVGFEPFGPLLISGRTDGDNEAMIDGFFHLDGSYVCPCYVTNITSVGPSFGQLLAAILHHVVEHGSGCYMSIDKVRPQ